MGSAGAAERARTLREVLRETETRLAGPSSSSSISARLDAELLVTHALGLPRHGAYSHPDRQLDRHELACVETVVSRCASGEPVAHLLGQREFWSMSFTVTPDTLVPRPETEHLVEQALIRLPANEPRAVLDAGTGTGAVAVAIAKERPRTHVWALDASREALTIARANADRLAPARIQLLLSDWFARLGQQTFDMIVSNPPYVEAGDPALRTSPLMHEPIAALASGPLGLDAISHIASHAEKHLLPGGWLLLEHGASQGAQVRELLDRHGFADVETTTDLAGHERITAGRRARVGVTASPLA